MRTLKAQYGREDWGETTESSFASVSKRVSLQVFFCHTSQTRFCTRTRFETEAQGNSNIAYSQVVITVAIFSQIL